MIDTVKTIVDAMNTELAGVLGLSYKPLQYVFDVERNSLRQSSDRYGVLHGAASQLPGVTRTATLTQAFTIVLVKGYNESAISDENAREASMSLYAQMLEIHKHMINTKAGAPSVVVHVESDLEIEDPEYIQEQKVTVLRANFNIIYRHEL